MNSNTAAFERRLNDGYQRTCPPNSVARERVSAYVKLAVDEAPNRAEKHRGGIPDTYIDEPDPMTTALFARTAAIVGDPEAAVDLWRRAGMRITDRTAYYFDIYVNQAGYDTRKTVEIMREMANK